MKLFNKRPLLMVLIGIMQITLGVNLSFAAYTGQCIDSKDVSELPPGHWCEVPNSKLTSVEKLPQDWPDWNGSSSASYNSYQRNIGIESIVSTWSGGAFDSTRDRLLIFGGGHNGYGGNEILAFSLNTLQWERITDPTAYSNRSPAIQNDDGTPISRHTYGGLAYIEHADRLFALGGAPDSAAGGCGLKGTWTYPLSAATRGNSETNGQYWELRSGVNEPLTGCDDVAVYDPISKRVFYHVQFGPGNLASYDFETNTWTSHSADGHGSGTQAVVDTKRHRIYEFGGGGGMRSWQIPDNPIGSMTYTAINTTGINSMERADDPGAAYDISADRIVAWNGGTTVYSFNPSNNEWQQHDADAGNLANPGPVQAAGGVFGRFRYSKRLNVYVTVDSATKNVFLYKFAPGSGISAQSLPSAPLQLSVQ